MKKSHQKSLKELCVINLKVINEIDAISDQELDDLVHELMAVSQLTLDRFDLLEHERVLNVVSVDFVRE